MLSTVEGGGYRRAKYCLAEDGTLENCKNTCWLKTKHLFAPYDKCLEDDKKLEDYENNCWLKTKHLFNAYFVCKETCVKDVRTIPCWEPSDHD